MLKAIGLADSSLIKAYRNAYLKRIKKLEIDTTQFKDEFEIPEADFGNRDKIDHEQKQESSALRLQEKIIIIRLAASMSGIMKFLYLERMAGA